jgi:hypothetical protein
MSDFFGRGLAGFFGEVFFGLFLPDGDNGVGLSSSSSLRDLGAIVFKGPRGRGAVYFLGPFGPRLSGLLAPLPALSPVGVDSTSCAIDETLT